ncbi:STAS domain-containing protein [Desulfovibrio sp. OttesenSCG-928-I05]|nr:STAS domain-containing protein [Desulfovibrio sp. OttesenSCG-928-I05]
MYSPFKFRPKLFDCLSGYSMKTFGADLSAGVTVGVIALPMAMAFAIGSGVTPAAGIITAVVAGFLTSFLGGSRVAIGGPTGAFVAIVAGIVATHGVQGLLICTMMAGVMLLLMGLIRLGVLIRFMPSPLVKGFTTGIAVIILCGQLKDLLGINAETAGSANVILAVSELVPLLDQASIPTFIVGILCVAGILCWPKKLGKRVPSSIMVMLLATVASMLLASYAGIELETIGSRFGGIPRSVPAPSLPVFDLATFQTLLAPAMTIALLGAIESLLCAAAADAMIDDQHNPDQELMAQGIANIITPLFGGIPATGAIARTAANIRNGGRTPIAGMIHAIVLLLIMLLAAPLARYIPLAVLSAVLIVVGINMGDWKEFTYLRRYPRSDVTVFLVTFLLTIIFGLTQAVTVGMFAACILFIRRMSEQSRVWVRLLHHRSIGNGGSGFLPEEGEEGEYHQGRPDGANGQDDTGERNDDLLLINLTGAMFFGAAQKLRRIMRYSKQPPKVVVLQMSTVISLDATAITTLDDIIGKFRKKGVEVILVGLHSQPLSALTRSGVLRDLVPGNIVRDMDAARRRADDILENRERDEA